MIPRLVPEIEGGYPERVGGEGEEEGAEGLVLTYSSKVIYLKSDIFLPGKLLAESFEHHCICIDTAINCID